MQSTVNSHSLSDPKGGWHPWRGPSSATQTPQEPRHCGTDVRPPPVYAEPTGVFAEPRGRVLGFTTPVSGREVYTEVQFDDIWTD